MGDQGPKVLSRVDLLKSLSLRHREDQSPGSQSTECCHLRLQDKLSVGCSHRLACANLFISQLKVGISTREKEENLNAPFYSVEIALPVGLSRWLCRQVTCSYCRAPYVGNQ